MGGLGAKLATGIGFVAEVRQYNKAKKAVREQRELGQGQEDEQVDDQQLPRRQSDRQELERRHSERQQLERQPSDNQRALTTLETPPPDYNELPAEIAEDEDEREWELDEAQDELVEGPEPRRNRRGSANPDKLIAKFLERHPVPSPIYTADPASTPYKLEYPVVIPQRRPKDKQRGFIRAYAPDLQNLNIDQTTWLDFIETFNEASLANPWINALNLASLATNALPSAIAVAVSIAIQIATNAAMEAQSRYRQNKALDKLNKEFFRPRGLYCLVMTWDATSNKARTNVDLSTTIQESMNNQGNLTQRLQSSNGVTSEFEFMETAALTFPGLDYLASVPTEESQSLMKKIKRGKHFMDDYLDRRAQAKFVEQNPDNLLSKGFSPAFASKYADPTHPIHSGSLYSLVSLGRFNPPSIADMKIRSKEGLSTRLEAMRSQSSTSIGSLTSRLSEMRGDGRVGLLGRQPKPKFHDFYTADPKSGLFGLLGAATQSYRERNGYTQGQTVIQEQGVLRTPSEHEYYQQQERNSELRQITTPTTATTTIRRNNSDNDGLQGVKFLGGLRSRSGQNEKPLDLKRLLKKKVLYLMVVNMPTELEMEQAQSLASEYDIESSMEYYEEPL